MTRERLILCGSVADKELRSRDLQPLRLQLWGPDRNVRLKIADVRERLWRDLPERLLDLIDIATYVYTADQAIPRGGSGVEAFGEEWRRDLHFRIPVRCPEVWQSDPVHQALIETLSFLTEDRYAFTFERLHHTPQRQGYLDFGADAFGGQIEEVVLFSGGLDSLAGALQEAVLEHRQVLLVHHRSSPKLSRWHGRLLSKLQRKARRVTPMHVPVRINKKKALRGEYTQRSRSFLYMALGATLARMVGLQRLRFYENGVVSLNLPLLSEVVGARASRTTHPRVLQGYGRLLSLLTEQPFTVENRFLWQTKTEIVQLIAELGCGPLIRYTTSCAHTWEMTSRQRHCGTCSQCIDRRFAVLAAGQERHDPLGGYRIDPVLTGAPSRTSQRLLATYVELASKVGRWSVPEFFAHFGEASRVLRHLPGESQQTAAQLHELYVRHARSVTQVVDMLIGRHAAALRERQLPPGSLLRLVCAAPADHGTNGAPVVVKTETAAVHPNLFRRSGPAWEVRFKGRSSFILLPTKGAAYLALLLAHPGKSFTALELTCALSCRPELLAVGDAGERLDRQAMGAFRARLLELRDQRREAETNQDEAWLNRIDAEVETLERELRRSKGLGGRLRREQDDLDRVRKAVGNAVRRAIRKIAEEDKELAAHLQDRRNLQCGMTLRYSPDGDIRWDT